MEYKHFRKTEQQERVVRTAEALVDYIHKNKINNLVLVDKATRPVYLGVVKVWRKLFPDEKRPNIYFVNPLGFELGNRAADKVAQDLRNNQPYLCRDIESPLLIFDVCVHSGKTMSEVRSGFNAEGFSKILTATTFDCNQTLGLTKLDIGLPDACNPYKRDLLVTTGQGSISTVSAKQQDPSSIRESRQLRREIIDILSKAGYS